MLADPVGIGLRTAERWAAIVGGSRLPGHPPTVNRRVCQQLGRYSAEATYGAECGYGSMSGAVRKGGADPPWAGGEEGRKRER